jgi:hypothetical protein
MCKFYACASPDSEFRFPKKQTFEIERKLDILVIALVYMMIEGGVIKAFIVAPCFIKRRLIDFALY